MDPRHPQHPFSRNNASPYSHAPFQSNSNQAPFPPSSHAPNPTPVYQEHQRRPSDNPYYPTPSAFPRDAAPMPTSGHSRHASASSVGHGTPVNRAMPPPSSPQQQQQQQAPQHAQHSHSYVAPPLSRGPPPSLGTPLSFPTGPTGRDLPSLSSIHRPGSVNSSMSISSMLGGPPPAVRESTAPPQSQYPAPPPPASSAPSASYGAGPIHASPRIQAAGVDAGRFRRPQTPEPPRIHETQRVRDHRANSAGSPPGPAGLSTPEAHRYSTPQAYPQRNTQNQYGGFEERREHYPVRVPNPNTIPPRPSSQPTLFNGPSARPPDTARLVSEQPRPEPTYGRAVNYAEREREELLQRERQRLEDEAAQRRERERREAASFNTQPQARGHESLYGIAREAADSAYARTNPNYPGYDGAWGRRHEQPPPEQIAQPQPQQPQPPPATSSYEYSRPPAQSVGPRPADGYGVRDTRYPPSSYGQPMPTQPAAAQTSAYEVALQERERQLANPPQHPSQQQQVYHGAQPVQAPNAYRPQDSPRRPGEDIHQPQQRGYLGVQPELNRKGRTSPLPQAVQGAQGQISGPGSEPGIKNEFGKMFSGIGSGVGSMASTSNASAAAQSPFSNQGGLRRDDLDSVSLQEPVIENGAHKISRTASRGGGSGSRSRKLKDEDKGGDDSSSGRRTPSGRAKRPKTVHHHHSAGAHKHTSGPAHRYDIPDDTASPNPSNTTPLRNPAPAQPSPPAESKIPVPHHHHINRHHHHHHHVTHPKAVHVPIPKPKQIIRSQAVLDSVAHLPREHLGHKIYETWIEAEDSSHESRRGFVSSSLPLPRFEGKENCTFTIRVPRIHLTPLSREELTSRRAVWGTDVYTDDSDVIAACIHSGWFRGEWPKDVDISLLGLEIDSSETTKTNGVKAKSKEKNETVDKRHDIVLDDPPARGPAVPPSDRDLHITILILPALEKYSSTIRFGIKSREWGGTHDGVSFMIQNIRWVSGVDTSKEAVGKSRRLRMKVALEDGELEQEQSWGGLLEQGNGFHEDQGVMIRESYERGGPGPLIELKGLGTGGWWRERPNFRKGKKAHQVDVENQLPAAAADGSTDADGNMLVTDEQQRGDEGRPNDALCVS